jgi:tetratricopeptide (TPR) repeat protein
MGIVAVFLLGGTLHTPVGDGGLSARFTSESIVKITEGRLHSYGGVVTTSACAILDVARLLFFPLRLSVEYAAPVQESLLDACALAGVLLLVSSVAAALFALRHGRRTLFLAIAWVLLLYAPASNIVPVTHFFVADRYLFAPSFGACLLLALLFDWARARIPTSAGWLRRLPDVALVFLLLAFGIRFVSRNRDWRDEESLWASALHAGEKTYRTHYNMGTVLANQERYDEARVHLEKSLQLYPSAPAARRNMIELLIRQQKLGEAESHLRILVAAEPGDVPMRFRLARVLRAQNRFADALAESQTVLQLDPSHVGAHWTAAGCLENMGRASEALGAYREALHEIEALERRGQSSTVPPDRVRAKIRALESPGS